jgi:hypothetical protein
MVQRRRYVARDELVSWLVDSINADISRDACPIDKDTVGAVIDALAARGVNLGTLVKVMVDEDVAPDLQ